MLALQIFEMSYYIPILVSKLNNAAVFHQPRHPQAFSHLSILRVCSSGHAPACQPPEI